jgi:hypothetical protein
MNKGYQFRWSRPPQVREYVWPTVATLLALGLSVAGAVVLIDPAQRSGDPMDEYALWITALLSWLIPFFFWSTVATRRRQFQNGDPVLLVDDRGMSIRNWRGTMLEFLWSEIETFERMQSSRDDDLLIRAGKISGSIPLKDLDTSPSEIVETINRCSRRST